jgi:hypothetical protein
MSIKDQILASPELFRPLDLKARLVHPDQSEVNTNPDGYWQYPGYRKVC